MNSAAISLAAALDEIRMDMAAAAERNARGELAPKQAQLTFLATHKRLERIRRLTTKVAA